MTLVRRIVSEKRGALVPLVVALVLNIGVYVLVVRPLAAKSETSVDRAASAAQARRAAERDYASADALVRGTSTASQELTTFYGKVLPANFVEASRMTRVRLPALARKANMRMLSLNGEDDLESKRRSQLGRLRWRMTLEGGYESLRQFLYELETTSDFIIVDDVSLGQTEQSKPVTVTVELSTYYRIDRNGA